MSIGADNARWVQLAGSTAGGGWDVAVRENVDGWSHTGLYVATLAPDECRSLDLGDLAGTTEDELALRIVRIELLLQKVAALPIATMAVAGGRTFGAGADLFAACDRRAAPACAAVGWWGSARGLGRPRGAVRRPPRYARAGQRCPSSAGRCRDRCGCARIGRDGGCERVGRFGARGRPCDRGCGAGRRGAAASRDG